MRRARPSAAGQMQAHSGLLNERMFLKEAQVKQDSKIRRRRRRLVCAVSGLLSAGFAALLVWQLTTQLAGAQSSVPDAPLVIVNRDEGAVERQKDGGFRARPIFNQRLAQLSYGIRDADTGEWLTAIYLVRGGEDERDEGWRYEFDYPALDEQPGLDAERAYLLVLIAQAVGQNEPRTFYLVIPEYQPGGIFNKILGALNPERWARALAVWLIEGVHGALCAVLEPLTGSEPQTCAGE